MRSRGVREVRRRARHAAVARRHRWHRLPRRLLSRARRRHCSTSSLMLMLRLLLFIHEEVLEVVSPYASHHFGRQLARGVQLKQIGESVRTSEVNVQGLEDVICAAHAQVQERRLSVSHMRRPLSPRADPAVSSLTRSFWVARQNVEDVLLDRLNHRAEQHTSRRAATAGCSSAAGRPAVVIARSLPSRWFALCVLTFGCSAALDTHEQLLPMPDSAGVGREKRERR